MRGASSSTTTFSAYQGDITDFDSGSDLDAKISKSGSNTIVQIGDDRIELIGVKPQELSKFDFLFDA